jgi:microcystin-dependent protein
VGVSGGVSQVTLTTGNMPPHNHTLAAVGGAATGTTNDPSGQLYARGVTTAGGGTFLGFPFTDDATKSTPFAPNAILPTVIGAGNGAQPHNNMMPYLTLNFCIALQGEFPQRG